MRRWAVGIAAITTLSLFWSGPAPLAEAKNPPPPATLATATIDAHLGYLPQSTCSPTAKPGATALLKALIATWGGSSSGISRHCGVGATSEHKEGRALDWHMDARYAGQRKRVGQALAWLTANNGEVAYRLGVMYVIWNQRIWSLYYPELGWRKMAGRGSYTANHKNHVHISLSWDGALKQTSWWTGTPVTQPLNSACGRNGAPTCLPTIARTRTAWPFQSTTVPASFLPAPWLVPGIGGSPQVGRVLTTVPGTWVPTGATLGYQWLADGRPIAAATGPEYIVTAAELGRGVSVRVTSTTGDATGARTSAETAGVVLARFVTTAVATLSRTAPSAGTVGAGTLTAEPGAWSPQPDGLSYTWLRNGRTIKGASGATYLLAARDIGRKVSVRVTATRAGYAHTATTSKPMLVARAPFTSAPVPVVTGAAAVGGVLSVDPGAWTPSPSKLAYRWYANSKRIRRATAATLKLTPAQLGKQVQVRVSASLPGFTTTYVRSVPVVVVGS